MKQCVACGGHIKHRHHSALYCWQCNSGATGQAKALAEVAKAIRDGRLARPTALACVDCGAKATEYEHRDYSKPLDVDPICRTCNKGRGPAKAVLKPKPLFPVFHRVGAA